MSRDLILVEGVGKQYVLGRQARETTLRDRMAGLFRRREKPKPSPPFWALRDVSFCVSQGEVLGLIGHNGAGKSTLLKILSRITEPTIGRIALRGRVASLLEVGTGFHKELSGRENVFLNGAILGMRRAEIIKKFQQIVDFAGVGKFIDTPVKRYSSGMSVRLAFAVAAHLDPEILLIDEVLAVGDAEFQNRCLGKISEVSSSGRTIIFVSHNMAAIEGLCSKCLVLTEGRVVFHGATDTALARYSSIVTDESADLDLSSHPARVHRGLAILRRARLLNEEGEISSSIPLGQSCSIELHIDLPESVKGLVVGLHFYSVLGQRVASMHSGYQLGPRSFPAGTHRIISIIERMDLMPGQYRMVISVHDMNGMLDRIEPAMLMNVMDRDIFKTGKAPHRRDGVLVLRGTWEM